MTSLSGKPEGKKYFQYKQIITTLLLNLQSKSLKTHVWIQLGTKGKDLKVRQLSSCHPLGVNLKVLSKVKPSGISEQNPQKTLSKQTRKSSKAP